jgi:uncharacterized protein YceH (UPF0502 family)
MSDFNLNALETRVLGCLLEKERTTPENYPLSLNALQAACNQATNREPVVSYDEATVEQGVYGLRQKKLATSIQMGGARVLKYRHVLPDHYELNARETAVLCVLLLRGPQTPGELRARTERLCGALSLEAVEQTLEALGAGSSPLVRVLPARPGQKERRYLQLLSEPVAESEPVDAVAPEPRLVVLERQVAELSAQLQQLRTEFEALRSQLE